MEEARIGCFLTIFCSKIGKLFVLPVLYEKCALRPQLFSSPVSSFSIGYIGLISSLVRSAQRRRQELVVSCDNGYYLQILLVRVVMREKHGKMKITVVAGVCGGVIGEGQEATMTKSHSPPSPLLPPVVGPPSYVPVDDSR
jgi:hypothetical protein